MTEEWRTHWAVIWRSELRALTHDRELQEAEEAIADKAGRAWAAPEAWPTPAAVPPDAGGAAGAVARLERRLDELERRLARLDSAGP